MVFASNGTSHRHNIVPTTWVQYLGAPYNGGSTADTNNTDKAHPAWDVSDYVPNFT